MIEAWAPTRESCLEETVPALVDTFLRHSPTAATMTLPVDLQPAADDELLRLLLEDVTGGPRRKVRHATPPARGLR